MKRAVHILLLLIASCTLLQAQSVSELNKRRKKAEEEISYIDKLLRTNQNKQKSGIETLHLTRQKITQRKQIIADIDLQIHIIEKELTSKNTYVDDLQAHLEVLKNSYKNLLYQAYKVRDNRSWMMFVLAADDFGMAYRRWQYFKRFSEHLNELVADIRETTSKINTEINALTSKRQELSGYLNQKQAEMGRLEKEQTEAQQLIGKLSGQEKELRRKAEQQRKLIDKINQQIERIIAEEARKAEAARKKDREKDKDKASLPIDRTLTANFENNRGNLPWPVRKGVVISKFGQHAHPVYKGVMLPNNNGIDISTETNSPAIAVFNGTVTRVFNIPGMNNCVMLQHGEFYTLYCKLGNVQVKSGDKINVGKPIGTIVTDEGNTVLHFELWKGTQKQNPELWLAR